MRTKRKISIPSHLSIHTFLDFLVFDKKIRFIGMKVNSAFDNLQLSRHNVTHRIVFRLNFRIHGL